jgi:hypothetical protein
MRIVRYCILCGEIQERFGYWNNENFGVMPRTLGAMPIGLSELCCKPICESDLTFACA